MKKLTERQRIFADYYVESLNAMESAIRAGYTETYAKNNSYKLLESEYVKKYIEKLMRGKDKERIASQDEVLEYLTAVMRGEVDEEQIVVENMGDYTSRAKRMAKQVGARDRNKAAELLGKRYAIFTDKVENSGDITYTVKLPNMED